MIHVEGLSKTYRVPVKEPGLWGSVRSLWHRESKDVIAVNQVSLHIAPGERVGFLGPNGAGKTTTLKMLTGLLHPTAGQARVAGYTPTERDPGFLRAITLVMGQKQQLIWDLPASETFLLNRAVYDIPPADFAAARDELVSLLELGDFLDRPVRNLSLGQRMRCELAAALLHRPKVLFLDEPTIGLDVEVQLQVRRFIATYNQRTGATVLLTSHDMDDVAALAQRIVLIDKGSIKYDGPIGAFKAQFGGGRQLRVRGLPLGALSDLGFADEDGLATATVPAAEINALLFAVLQRAPHAEVTVQDPPLEHILATAFGEARATAPTTEPAR